jgi:hypothetical protein
MISPKRCRESGGRKINGGAAQDQWRKDSLNHLEACFHLRVTQENIFRLRDDAGKRGLALAFDEILFRFDLSEKIPFERPDIRGPVRTVFGQ